MNVFRVVLISSYFFASLSLAAEFKVGLLLEKAGKGDKSFNNSAYDGAKKAEKDLGIKLKVTESADLESAEKTLRSLASKKYDLLIAIGFVHQEPVKAAASAFKDQKFVLIDAKVPLNNVRSVTFAEHEGAFLVGALAARKSQSKKIGFVGGMDVPLIRRFETGYRSGAKHEVPKIEVVTHMIGQQMDAWSNPAKAKEIALAQLASGVDVIFHASGSSGQGVFDAVEEKKKWAIGVDSNQNGEKPGRILTSMLKRVDLAVIDSIKEAQAGSLKTGEIEYNLANGGIGYSVDEYNKSLLTPDDLKTLEKIKQGILDKKIHVPDFYKGEK